MTIGILGSVEAMGALGSSTSAGGWASVRELHSSGLVTSDVHAHKAIGQLAQTAPSLDDGSISLLPDGRMRVVYTIRQGVTWQDGTAFTARDLVFSYQILNDRGIPTAPTDAVRFIESVESPNDRSFVVNFKGPYYLGGLLGIRDFWPHPIHLLGDAYSRYLASKEIEEFSNLPYWTSQYVHTGPFRLTSFSPGEELTFEAYDGYFLGRPKVDIVRMKIIGNQNTLFANLLAGTVDLLLDGQLSHELGFDLKDRWDTTGEGTVYVAPGTTRFLAPQWRPDVQTEPAILDLRVRAALYQAIDRQAIADFRMQPAWSVLAPNNPYYEATRDALRPFAYNPDRAKSILQDAGWSNAPDGSLRNATDGRAFKNALWTTGGSYDWELPFYASYWRKLGLEVDEWTVPAPLVRNLEYRAHYPNWEASSGGSYDVLFGRFEGPGSTAESGWQGDRGGYNDPRGRELVGRFRTSLSERDTMQAMKAISDYVAADLPILIYYFSSDHVGVRKGILALDDVDGAGAGSSNYGTFSRNAHRWDVE
jgi:ABC-type transport system substrate-binding protein